MEHKKLGDKTLFLFVLKRSGFFFLSLIVLFAVIGLWGILPESLQRYVALANFLFVVFVLIVAAATFGIASLEYRNYTISVLEKNVKITRGILNRVEIGIPYRRVKRVDIIRTLMCQLLGVSNILITTLGDDDETSHDDEVLLPYIAKPLAEKIQHEILQHAQVEQIAMAHPGASPEETASRQG
jgi:uncharacterized membrane protein YdbT with pleckstrin-like domain